VLIFDLDGRLVMHNAAAETMLGGDMPVIEATGFSAAAILLNQQAANPDYLLEQARTRALTAIDPVPFQTHRAGKVLSCFLSLFELKANAYLMLTLETPEWGGMTATLGRFGEEMRGTIDSAKGHADLVLQILEDRKSKDNGEKLARNVSGFAKLIQTQMVRSAKLVNQFDRLSTIQTGAIQTRVADTLTSFDLAVFLEDLLEDIQRAGILDPETEIENVRDHIQLKVSGNLRVLASQPHLAIVLHDLIANAIMYTMRPAPAIVTAKHKSGLVQIDVIDEGIGIRDRDRERVFTPFERGTQPKVISEFGYGLSLYLCKYEIEAMNGNLWFESAEKAGSTFSIGLRSSAARQSPVTGSSSGRTR
jgi:signal transduction histidine kinase